MFNVTFPPYLYMNESQGKPSPYRLDVREKETVQTYAEGLGGAVDYMKWQGKMSHPKKENSWSGEKEDKSHTIVEFGDTKSFKDVKVVYDQPEYMNPEHKNGAQVIAIKMPDTHSEVTVTLERPRDYSGQGESPYMYNRPYALTKIVVGGKAIDPRELGDAQLVNGVAADKLQRLLVMLLFTFDHEIAKERPENKKRGEIERRASEISQGIADALANF